MQLAALQLNHVRQTPYSKSSSAYMASTAVIDYWQTE